MLLSEYDEQAHIESEKRIAREEGIEEGIIKGIQEGIQKGIQKGMVKGRQEGENLLVQLVQYLQRDGRLQDIELLSDEDTRKKLYKEYNLAD